MLIHVLYGALCLLRLSYRFKVVNPEVLEKVRGESGSGNYIFAMWHRNIFSYMAFYYGIPHTNLASQSRNGAMISKLLEKIGHGTVRGSSSRGGRGAIMAFVRLLKKGYPGTIAVDGPRGPAGIPKEGIFLIAKMSGVKIVPLSFIPQSCHSFEKSWDRFRLPLPFSRIEVCYGHPMVVSPECSRQEFRRLGQQLQECLNG